MPSRAYFRWRHDRSPRLAEVEAQCAATLASAAPNPLLADENLRGYVVLLSSHLQGFCRDLHTECVMVIAAAVPAAMQFAIQSLGLSGRELDGANPKFETIRGDFERFALNLSAALSVQPANALRITHVGHLNLWRNYVAHHKLAPPTAGGPLTLPAVRDWRTSCDGLAAELDRIMYNQLRALTGAVPW